MVKYGIKIVLETENQFRPTTFSVDECSSIEQAEAELKQWINKKKELMSHAINQRLIKETLE